MKEQIEEIYEVLVTDCGMTCHECDYEGDDLCVAHRKAEAIYNAGYRKQKEGEWVMIPVNGVVRWRCGNIDCARIIPFGTVPNELNYCPNCGAHMRGGKNE